MSFQDNKFPILLGVTTAVLTGGLIYWGMSSSGKYTQSKDDYDSARGELKRLTSGPAYPNAENVGAKTKAVGDYRASVDELQKAFDKYRVAKVENVGVDVFGDALLASRTKVLEAFEAVNAEMPEGANLGLSIYTQETVKKQNTGILLYQLGAFQELFEKLAAARPKELLNIHRPLLPEERGQKPNIGGKGYREHAIEISFVAREETLRQFLSSLDDSEKYLYAVRTMRIRNEDQDAPQAKDARFEKPRETAEADGGGAAADNPFGGGGFVFPDDEEEGGDDAEEEVAEPEPEPEPEDSSDSGQILKQVLGDEYLEVFLRIDVIQFLDPKPLPQG